MQNDREGVRLNKWIADSGFCSRREADRLIADGQVRIDGRVGVLGDKVLPGTSVTVGGTPVTGKSEKIYIALNKPRGIVCTADPREPMNVVAFIGPRNRIFPIGRLDKDSEGLLLLTSDGEIVNRVLRAAGGHEKEYEVTVNKPVTADFIRSMAKGVPILDTVTLPCRIRKTGENSFTIILIQGLNRQIRRMCEYFGYDVVALRRVRVMNIRLARLQPGHWRNLTDDEMSTLFSLLEQAPPPFSRQGKQEPIDSEQ